MAVATRDPRRLVEQFSPPFGIARKFQQLGGLHRLSQSLRPRRFR